MARTLRCATTYPEVLLWQRLRGTPNGFRFRRQHPIGPYVADFCCLPAKLVIKKDGEVHAAATCASHDACRDDYLSSNGYRVIRIGAADVLRDVEAVAASIVALAAAPLHHSPSASGPPPRVGEE